MTGLPRVVRLMGLGALIVCGCVGGPPAVLAEPAVAIPVGPAWAVDPVAPASVPGSPGSGRTMGFTTIPDAMWSPDGRRLALGEGVVDVRSGETIPFDCESNGRVVWGSSAHIVCDRYTSVALEDLVTGQAWRWEGAGDARFLAGGAVLAWQSGAGALHLWDVQAARAIATLPSPEDGTWQFTPCQAKA